MLPLSLTASFSLRWKGDCGGKKQLWFPANYVEEMSPSAVEPDRTVRAQPTKWSGFNYTFVYRKRDVSWSHVQLQNGASTLFHYPSLFCQAGDDREQPTGRSVERKCGRVFLSDWWVAPPLPVLPCMLCCGAAEHAVTLPEGSLLFLTVTCWHVISALLVFTCKKMQM